MSRNPFILAKLQKIRDNAAHRRHVRRLNTLSQSDQLYNDGKLKKSYTAQQIERVRFSYKKQVRIERFKTMLVWIITVFITPLLFYLLIIYMNSD